jgi:nitrite reductase/ring-hydroxylating ferredoxin subunit
MVDGGRDPGDRAMTAADEPRPSDPAVETADREGGDVLAEVERLIAALNAHPDPTVGESVTALLDRVDLVHRTGLGHLMGAIQSMAGDAFVNRLTADPAIRLLLMSYDLLAVDRRVQAEEALDGVRGHLHAHGVEVELVDVLGGVVTVRLHGPPPGHPALDGARRDVEAALRAGLLGFQEVELSDDRRGRSAPAESVFLPRDSLRRAQRPVYQTVCRADELSDGAVRSGVVDGSSVLVARVGDEFFAVRNACGDTPLPLDFSTLTGTELRCSWHGCRYDIRTGRRLDRPEAARDESLRVLPVRVHEGLVEVVVATTAAA